MRKLSLLLVAMLSATPLAAQCGVNGRLVPVVGGKGSMCAPNTDVKAGKVMITRVANGAIAAHTLVKGVAGGKVGPVASDTEGILGVAENATTTDGDTVYVTVQGPTTVLAEGSITDLHYLVAGTSDPTKAKDSGATARGTISLSARIAGKALGADAAGSVAVNVIGPYQFGAMIAGSDLPAAASYWQKVSLAYTDNIFKAAATTVTKTLVALPAHAVVEAIRVKSSAAFAGTAVTSCTLSLGDGTTADIFAPAYTLTAVVGNTNIYTDGGAFAVSDAATNLVASVTCNVNTGSGSATILSAGGVDVHVKYAVLP